MYVYVLDRNDFVESEEGLFENDIAMLIDQEKKMVYLWFGPNAKGKDRGLKIAEEKMAKFKLFEMIALGDSVPLKIQAEIDELMAANLGANQEKMERTVPMRGFTIVGGISLLLMFAVVINNFRMLSWDYSTYYYVDEWSFYDLFSLSVTMCMVIIGINVVQLIMGAAAKRMFLMINAAATLGMSIGLMLYLAQGEFIFQFQPGASADYIYQIRRVDIIIHDIWLVVMLIGSAIPTFLGRKSIRKETEIREKVEEDIEDIMRKSRPTILQDRMVGLKKAE